MGWPAQVKVRGAHGPVNPTAGSVLVSEPPLPPQEAGWLGTGASAPPSKRGSGATSAGVEQECCPRKGLGKKGHFAKHDFHEVPDRIGGIRRASARTQPAIDKQLKQIESERPKKQDRHQGILRVMKNVPEVPILDPLVKRGVFDVPAGTDDLWRRSTAQLARADRRWRSTKSMDLRPAWLPRRGPRGLSLCRCSAFRCCLRPKTAPALCDPDLRTSRTTLDVPQLEGVVENPYMELQAWTELLPRRKGKLLRNPKSRLSGNTNTRVR